MSAALSPLERARAFAARYDLDAPILMAPMAGASPPELAIAVANGGGMGACGALLMQPDAILEWAAKLRSGTNGGFQLNTWIPDAPPARDAAHETALRDFLGGFGPEVAAELADATGPDFDAQCEAILRAGPAVVSSIMGLFPPDMIREMKSRGIAWFANVTCVAEARQALDAGADALVAQGMEAGGHRGSFTPETAEQNLVGLFALLPALVDLSDRPVIATGGIADARGVAAALMLGASAVQIGTALLRAPEAGIPAPWADALAQTPPEATVPTRAFSGRLGRALRSGYTDAAANGPAPAPYPVQRALTGPMRSAAAAAGNLDHMQTWAGQSAALARPDPAAQIIRDLWQGAQRLLAPSP
ncbi:MAG: NAD(P)H-dependent flavin oxidoreductase [Sulfitobacter sp.]